MKAGYGCEINRRKTDRKKDDLEIDITPYIWFCLVVVVCIFALFVMSSFDITSYIGMR